MTRSMRFAVAMLAIAFAALAASSVVVMNYDDVKDGDKFRYGG